MHIAMTDLNPNLNPVLFLSTPQSPPILMQAPLIEAFSEYGLVQALLPAGEQQEMLWHNVYIIAIDMDSRKSPKKSSSEKVCSVVIAIDDEDPVTTLSQPKNVHKCSIDQIRLMIQFDPEINFSDSEMVQVSIESFKPFICWKPAKIKMTKANFFVVALGNLEDDSASLSNDFSKFEIVSKERLRPLHAQQQLSKDNNPFFQFDLQLSQNLLKFFSKDFQWLSTYDLHKDFKKRLQIINMTFDKERKLFSCLAFSLINCSTEKEQIIKRSQMLASMHFSSLQENYLLSASMNSIKEQETTNKPEEFIMSISVLKQYVGLAIGKSGANIQKARHLSGIYSLDLHEPSSSFIIRGKSRDICHEAAALIYFTEEYLTYPKDYVLFFKERQLIEEIERTSAIVKYKVFAIDDLTEQITLLIVGKPEAIENFKILISFQKSEFDEINSLKMQNKMLFEAIFNQDRVSVPFGSISNAPRNFAEAVKSGIIKH